MRIRMTTSMPCSRDGASTEQFHKGNFYDLRTTERERELAKVLVKNGWAEEDDREVERMPLIEEYVRAGYSKESYAQFVKDKQEEADANGFIIEWRAPNAEELAKMKRDDQAKLEADRIAREADEKAKLEAETAAKIEADKAAAAQLEAAKAPAADAAPAVDATAQAPSDVPEPAPTPPAADTTPDSPKSKQKTTKGK